ncbi:MAG: hypothetical protein AAFN09_07465 [Pseudomonadota bacterium]
MASAFGFTNGHEKTAKPVRKIVHAALEVGGLPAYGPHAFRHLLAAMLRRKA